MNTAAEPCAGAVLDRIRVVLSRTTHPGNIGAAARAMKTMGLTRLCLVSPKIFPSAEAEARAVGADDVLRSALVCSSLDDALVGTVAAIACSARRRDLSHPRLTPREAARVLLDYARDAEVALVFGAEMSGLSTGEAIKCRWIAQIPTDPAYSSLNLAAAVQVMAYELRVALADVREKPSAISDPASFEEIELLYAQLEQTMIAIGFLDPARPKRLMQRLRRLFARSGLEKQEVNILRGLLSAIK